MQETVIRCPLKCVYGKRCFVCKTAGAVQGEITILHKCCVTGKDVLVRIGNRPE